LDIKGAADRDRICIGVIAGAHGLQGALRIKPFTDLPEDVAAYGPVSDEKGKKEYQLNVKGVREGMVTASVAGVDNRTAAEALKGQRLYVARSALPLPDNDEFYHADLLGLDVFQNKEKVGSIRSIISVGEQEVLEIDQGPGTEFLLVPFTKTSVPCVDIEEGKLTIIPFGTPEQVEKSPIVQSTNDRDLKSGRSN
tara:strand:- start:76 stop:663 length:588 start_codon:yes stop_codon:yes gene_type:complete